MKIKAMLMGAALAGALVLHMGTALSQEDPNLVVMQNDLFLTPELVVPVGTTVTWYNADVQQHDVVERHTLAFFSPLINQGEWWQLTFDTPGYYQYVCDLHANMEGAVTVAG